MAFEITIMVRDTSREDHEQAPMFQHTYDEPPMLLAIENPSIELGLSLGTDYDEWQRRFDGSEYNFLNRNMGDS